MSAIWESAIWDSANWESAIWDATIQDDRNKFKSFKKPEGLFRKYTTL
jgi:hypothetical protein